MKPSLTFYTNIVSPYQLDLFESLSSHFVLSVIYYTKNESDRLWSLNEYSANYSSRVLKNSRIASLIQKFFISFHFSIDIVRTAISDTSDSIIVSGNYFIPNSLIVFIIAVIKRRKVYWFGEKLFPVKNFPRWILKRILLSPMFISCRGIFCIGQLAVDSYKSFGYTGKCFLTNYSVDSSKYDVDLLDQAKIHRMQNSLNPLCKKIIISVGGLDHRKGFDIAIRSFLSLSTHHKQSSELWILGDGPLMQDLKLLAGSHQSIKFFGFVDPHDIPYFLSISNLFLFCSRYDGWGVVVNEAISSALPVIVSSAVTASELIESSGGGFVCDFNNINLFTESLEFLLSNSELAKEMSSLNKSFSIRINSDSVALQISRNLA